MFKGKMICAFCFRVLPGERAPEGKSEMLPAALVWRHSSWRSGEPQLDLELLNNYYCFNNKAPKNKDNLKNTINKKLLQQKDQ